MHIVSLGSSFAAGPGILPIANEEAGRSKNNYPSLLASKLHAQHTDLSVSGATLLNLLSDPQGSFPPQISQIPSDADVVTITCGGNDMGLVGGLGQNSKWSWWILGSMINLFNTPITDEDLVSRFQRVFAAVQVKAPKARVILAEYPVLLGSHARPGPQNPLTQDLIKKHQRKMERFVKVMRKSVEGTRVELVPISELSWDHGVGSPEAWVNGYDSTMESKGIAPWHPNLKGMEAIADILFQQM